MVCMYVICSSCRSYLKPLHTLSPMTQLSSFTKDEMNEWRVLHISRSFVIFHEVKVH